MTILRAGREATLITGSRLPCLQNLEQQDRQGCFLTSCGKGWRKQLAMSDKRRDTPISFFSASRGSRYAVAFLLAFFLLASGCAAIGGHGAESGATDKVRSGRLPFPASRRAAVTKEVAAEAAIEPTVVSYPDYRDPIIHLNRAIFAFNDVTYRYFLIPLGKGYVQVVPELIRKGISNFFDNIKTPIYAVNNLLQLKPEPLGKNIMRFGLNTTIGLLGLFDPATDWFEIKRQETHFDDTLAQYGAGYGVYLVLPIFGPSDLRHSTSLVVDYFLNPITYLTDNPERSSNCLYEPAAPGNCFILGLAALAVSQHLVCNLHFGIRQSAPYS
jgi:phospholipid-binding lipoprotein MlaA